MRRLVTLAFLLFFTIPFGVSIAGCGKKTTVVYCNGGDSGLVVGQVTTLTLTPRLTGISLNQGEIGQANTPTATDCKGTTETVSSFTYGTSNQSLVDIVPTTGRICAGSWNRNTGGAIADYTTCNTTTATGTAFITATSNGVTSNPIAVYVHPIVTSILLGAPSTNCLTDPASNCTLDATQTNGCATATPASTAGVANYTETGCVSQGAVVQLAARVYKGTDTTAAANNISCIVGPLTFSAQTASIATFNQAGQATAVQPGSTIVNAATSNSSSSAGFFSVCPPAKIALTLPGVTGTTLSLNQNTPQTITATVTDTLGASLTNLTLSYVSTTPTTIPVTSGTVTPAFPGSAEITASCQPPSCNTSPYNQISLFGNGLTVTSNPITINTPGTSSSVIYVGSTDSQYIIPVDFTGTNLGSPVRLPFVPNSMVISQDLSTLYLGSTTEMMVVSAATSAITKEVNGVAGKVLAVSPDSSTVVITDPTRSLIYLYNATSGAATTEYGGIGTHASWSADSSTVYVTTQANHLLTYSTFTGWNDTDLSGTTTTAASDAAVSVPNAGVFLGGTPETARSYCPTATVTGAAGSQVVTNIFTPRVDATTITANADRLAVTNDGKHVFGANTANFSDLGITVPTGACPTSPTTATFSPAVLTSPLFTGLTASAITGVVTTSDSAFGFVTYTGTGGVVPQYNPATLTLSNITLTGTATAPVAATISTDNQTVFVGTSGDNLVHLLLRGTNGFTDSTATSSTGIKIPVTPLLPSISGSGYAVPNLIVQRPRKLTS